MNISGKTKIVGVWGHPVSHSRSPSMHNVALKALGLDWAYVAFDVAPADLPAAVAGIRALGLIGVNLTVPHKELILPLLDEVDEEAQKIGSVNTISSKGGKLYGTSTDGRGFLHALEQAKEPTQGRRALILGAGGSARAVAFALAGQGGHIQISNRTPERAQALVERVNQWHPGAAKAVGWGGGAEEYDLLVNTTSLGMDPHPDTMPLLPPDGLTEGMFVCDLVYAPLETRLLRTARLAGCRTMNGLPMLVAQGALSLSIWSGAAWESLPLGIMMQAALQT